MVLNAHPRNTLVAIELVPGSASSLAVALKAAYDGSSGHGDGGGSGDASSKLQPVSPAAASSFLAVLAVAGPSPRDKGPKSADTAMAATGKAAAAVAADGITASTIHVPTAASMAEALVQAGGAPTASHPPPPPQAQKQLQHRHQGRASM